MIILTTILLLTFMVLMLLNLLSCAISNNSLEDYTREESSSYECGFEQNSASRVPLSIRYFMLTLVFLVFDMEIMLLLFTPYEFFMGMSPSYISLISLIFILLLFLGLLYEWYDGALEWTM